MEKFQKETKNGQTIKDLTKNLQSLMWNSTLRKLGSSTSGSVTNDLELFKYSKI